MGLTDQKTVSAMGESDKVLASTKRAYNPPFISPTKPTSHTREIAVTGVGLEELRGRRDVAKLLQPTNGGETSHGHVKAIRRQQLVQIQVTSDLLHDRFHLYK